mmetsp:Transcript_43398/g.134099  ORF Transcript_43398/g.134099 Transcript_43398/m.134099 type:complete len:211 (-) Transcript_43398:307-939(-)
MEPPLNRAPPIPLATAMEAQAVAAEPHAASPAADAELSQLWASHESGVDEWRPYGTFAGAMDALVASAWVNRFDDKLLAQLDRLWLACPGDANATLASGEPVLFAAMRKSWSALAVRLLDAGADPTVTFDGLTAAHVAVKGVCPKVVSRLHAAGVTLHDSNKPLVAEDGTRQPLAQAAYLDAAREMCAAMRRADPSIHVDDGALEALEFG